MKKSGKRRGGGNCGKEGSGSRPLLVAGVAILVYGAFEVKRRGWGRPEPEAPEGPSLYGNRGRPANEDPLARARQNLFEKDGTSAFARSAFQTEDGVSRFVQEDYWDERYSKDSQEEYDWFGTWTTDTSAGIRIKPHVDPFMPAKVGSRILNLGCGNSRMPEELYRDGYPDVMSIDISQKAIDLMTQRFAQIPALSFVRMDMTAMTFPNASFDVVFDKGTLDALYTGASSMVPLSVQEVFRVLRPGGLFVSMSFGAPSHRTDLNATSGGTWGAFRTLELSSEYGSGKSQMFYLYLATKPVDE